MSRSLVWKALVAGAVLQAVLFLVLGVLLFFVLGPDDRFVSLFTRAAILLVLEPIIFSFPALIVIFPTLAILLTLGTIVWGAWDWLRNGAREPKQG